MIPLEEYKELLESHDWKALDSKDPKIREKGTIERNNLLRIAYISAEHRRAFFTAKEKHQPFCGH